MFVYIGSQNEHASQHCHSGDGVKCSEIHVMVFQLILKIVDTSSQLISCLTGIPTDCRLTYWWLTGLLDDLHPGCDWLTDWLADWLTDEQQLGWMTDWLIDWLNDSLVDQWQFTVISGCIAGWLTDWLSDWLQNSQTDRLTDWLTGNRLYTDWLTTRCKLLSC